MEDFVTSANRVENGFEIGRRSGRLVTANKLILATGIADVLPEVGGFVEWWGKRLSIVRIVMGMSLGGR